MFLIKDRQNQLLLFILVLSLFFLTCEMDHGLEPIRSGISGTIRYIGDWPQNTAEVRIVAATKFPPSEFIDLELGDSFLIGGDSTTYIFYLKPGGYYLGLIWRARNAPWGLQSIFSIYADADTMLLPSLITIPDEKTIVAGKEIKANFANARKVTDSHISGTITFIGKWPENVENFMVIASTNPQILPKSLFELSFSSVYPAYVDSYDYSISAAPGTYSALGVVIKIKDVSWGLENLKGVLLKNIVVPTDTSNVKDVNFLVTF